MIPVSVSCVYSVHSLKNTKGMADFLLLTIYILNMNQNALKNHFASPQVSKLFHVFLKKKFRYFHYSSSAWKVVALFLCLRILNAYYCKLQNYFCTAGCFWDLFGYIDEMAANLDVHSDIIWGLWNRCKCFLT